MTGEPRILPNDLISAVDLYAEKELSDADKYTNREPLDDSGIWSLHQLAAQIYARGWSDGERAEATRSTGERLRVRERARRELQAKSAVRVDDEEINQ